MSSFGFLGFTFSAALYLLFTVMLVTSWRGRLQGGLMLAACVVAFLWSLLFAIQSEYRIVPVGAIWASPGVVFCSDCSLNSPDTGGRSPRAIDSSRLSFCSPARC